MYAKPTQITLRVILYVLRPIVQSLNFNFNFNFNSNLLKLLTEIKYSTLLCDLKIRSRSQSGMKVKL